MHDKDDPLLRWNELNRENAEQDLAAAMFTSLLSTSPLLDEFSTWLLAGTGATAAFFLTNIQNILPFLTERGFKLCGAALVVSALFGLAAKATALRAKIAYVAITKVQELTRPIFEKHFEQRDQIEAAAEQRGLALDTKLKMERALEEFVRPFPSLIRFFIQWQVSKSTKVNPRLGAYFGPTKGYVRQSLHTAFQTIAFIAFVIIGVVYAKAI